MAKLTGKGLAEHCKAKLGTPYVYGAKGNYGKLTASHLNSLINAYPNVFTNSYIVKARKFVGQVCTDCSGLISWYTGKILGSYQMYSTASKRGLINDVDKAPIGAVLWRSGHVGVKIDDTYFIEAKGINYGTVKTKIKDAKFTHWLLFDYIDYDESAAQTSAKGKNPYKEPTRIIYYDKLNRKIVCTGDDVKWVQWELLEAGFNLVIDGKCGPDTDKAIREFQQSCKIKIDGKVGQDTRKHLKAA